MVEETTYRVRVEALSFQACASSCSDQILLDADTHASTPPHCFCSAKKHLPNPQAPPRTQVHVSPQPSETSPLSQAMCPIRQELCHATSM